MTTKKEKEEEINDEDVFADVGIMFEGSHATTLQHYDYKNITGGSSAGKNIHIALRVIDDEPGAVQSGHYLWPASPALSEFLVQQLQPAMEEEGVHFLPTSILELGAGQALAGLTALQLFAKQLKCLVVTDHDPGTLERARDNYETTLEEIYERAQTEEEQFSIVNDLGSIPVEFESLEWGDPQGHDKIRELIQEHGDDDDPPTFDLVLGSDLVYCADVVEPLLETASQLMSRSIGKGRFLLSQSFVYDDATEAILDQVSSNLNLQRILHVDTLLSDKENGVRIQEFRFRPSTTKEKE
jgi:predicted nicotinamide N-methyase